MKPARYPPILGSFTRPSLSLSNYSAPGLMILVWRFHEEAARAPSPRYAAIGRETAYEGVEEALGEGIARVLTRAGRAGVREPPQGVSRRTIDPGQSFPCPRSRSWASWSRGNTKMKEPFPIVSTPPRPLSVIETARAYGLSAHDAERIRHSIAVNYQDGGRASSRVKKKAAARKK